MASGNSPVSVSHLFTGVLELQTQAEVPGFDSLSHLPTHPHFEAGFSVSQTGFKLTVWHRMTSNLGVHGLPCLVYRVPRMGSRLPDC